MRFAIILCFLITAPLFAEVGDTISVVAHDNTQMVWNVRYDEEVSFNLGDRDIAEAKMNFTLGCADAHCSDWDYTVHIYAGIKDGTLDSSINVIDTISVDPFVADTTWNFSDHYDYYELGRLITPYGTYMNTENPAFGIAGFDETWTHLYEFDVTDYVGMLREDTRIRIYYDGWQTGFSADVSFDFIEGTPAREARQVQNILGAFTYTNQNDVENGPLAPSKVFVPEGTESARINVWYSGHGADNAGCAEFCEKGYRLEVAGQEIAEQSLWRDDCGLVPIFPQGGTWIFNRGNWCPGDKIERYEHDVSDLIVPGDSLEFDFDLFNHYNTSGGANFRFDVQLVTYGPSNFIHDVAMVDIIAPSTKDAHSRKNPICGQPIIKIKNNGSSTLSSAWIRYGVVEGIDCWHQWTGSLPAQEEVEVTLPLMNWFNLNDDPRFFAEVLEPSGQPDAYAENNLMYSQVEAVTNYEDDFVVFFRTNNRPAENSWELLDSEGNILESDDDFFANTEYEVLINVNPGCYTFVFKDHDPALGGGDGLAWWANNDESDGLLQIRNESGGLIENLQTDFGSEMRFNFTRGYNQGSEPFGITCATFSGIEDATLTSSFDIYPNPNQGDFVVDLGERPESISKVEIFNTAGQMVYEKSVVNSGSSQLSLTMPNVEAGVYFVKVINSQTSPSWRSMVITK